MRLLKNKRFSSLAVFGGLLVPKITFALCNANATFTYDPRSVIMIIINVLFGIALWSAIIVLPIGIIIRARNKKGDQKKYKMGVRMSAISGMTIVIIVALYTFFTFISPGC